MSEDWDQWWHSLAALGSTAVRVEAASREAPAAIDAAIKQLDALRRSIERRLQVFRLVQADIDRLASRVVPQISLLRNNVTALRNQLDDLKRIVTEEQARLSDLRRLQSALEEKTQQLKTLAALALRHLEDRCPVCAQTYDKEATRLRLEAMAKDANQNVQTPAEPENLPQFLTELSAKEKECAAAELALRSAEQAVNEQQMAQETLNARLTELGIIVTDDASRSTTVANAIAEAEATIHQLAEFRRIGESLALRLAESSALAGIAELRSEAETLRRETVDRERVVAARNHTGDQAQRVIEALREAGSAVVQERLREIAPILQSIYTRIDPHPAFRLVSFLSRITRGRGQLSTVISDPIGEKQSNLPATVLSSSQVNALAVSVFLALNIGVPTPPLSVAILDDPLQSLDDINLLGLVDLLRRVKDRRQLFVSTHDGRFGSLLSRKLRPSNKERRTIVIELDGWSRLGPSVVTREVESDPVPLRLVASRA
jgi:DNA repair exonuclease SbcCD ATPase subunit